MHAALAMLEARTKQSVSEANLPVRRQGVAHSTGMQVAVQHAGKHYNSALQPAADDTAGPPLVAGLLGQLAFPGRARVGAQRPLVLRVRLLQRAQAHLRRAPLSMPLCGSNRERPGSRRPRRRTCKNGVGGCSAACSAGRARRRGRVAQPRSPGPRLVQLELEARPALGERDRGRAARLLVRVVAEGDEVGRVGQRHHALAVVLARAHPGAAQRRRPAAALASARRAG